MLKKCVSRLFYALSTLRSFPQLQNRESVRYPFDQPSPVGMNLLRPVYTVQVNVQPPSIPIERPVDPTIVYTMHHYPNAGPNGIYMAKPGPAGQGLFEISSDMPFAMTRAVDEKDAPGVHLIHQNGSQYFYCDGSSTSQMVRTRFGSYLQ